MGKAQPSPPQPVMVGFVLLVSGTPFFQDYPQSNEECEDCHNVAPFIRREPEHLIGGAHYIMPPCQRLNPSKQPKGAQE